MTGATITNQGGQTSMTATFSPVTGAGSYAFYTPCGGFGASISPVTLNFRDSCHGAMFDLLGVAVGGTLTSPGYNQGVGVGDPPAGSLAVSVPFPQGVGTRSEMGATVDLGKQQRQQTVPVTQNFITLYMADYDNIAGYDQFRQMPETLVTPSIGTMGAFAGMPFQRRIIAISASPIQP